MKIEQNTAKEVLKAQRVQDKSQARKKKESMERLIQNYYDEKDTGNKKRLLAIIKVKDPDFKPE